MIWKEIFTSSETNTSYKTSSKDTHSKSIARVLSGIFFVTIPFRSSGVLKICLSYGRIQ
jgi:hypothetical protein